MNEPDRVSSFSYKPYDTTAIEAVAKLKAYGKSRGISFSYLVIKAIIKFLEELENDKKSRIS